MSEKALRSPAGVPKKKKMVRLERKNTLIAYSFLAPNFIGFAVFTLVPVILSIAMSFTEWNGGSIANMRWIGLENYANIFQSAKVGTAMAENGFFAGSIVPLKYPPFIHRPYMFFSTAFGS